MPNDTPDYMNFEVNFTDITLLEGNGEYEYVKKIMQKPVRIIGEMFAPPPSEKWAIKSNLTITHELGFAQITCDFYDDGRIIIDSYASTSKDTHRPDMRCFSHWAQKSGWKVPEPHQNLIREDQDFWKMQWETFIVESEFLQKRFGDRLHSYVDDNVDQDDIDDDGDDNLEEEIQKL